jgi:DHA3 family macrolide efflux protein-like MFS transporter
LATHLSPVDLPVAEALSMRRFFIIWTGQAISVFGSELVEFALIWYLTVQSRSAIVLTLATLTQMLPRTVLGPFVGVWIDRWNRRYVMQIADALTASVTMVLAVLFHLGLAQIWHIYGLLFAAALGQTMHASAFTASTTLMVPANQLTRIGGLNQVLAGATAILAPPAGALLIETFAIQSILAIDVATAIVAVTSLFFVQVPQPRRRTRAEQASMWQDVAGSFKYVWTWSGLAIVTGISMMLNFMLVPAFSLLSLIVLEYFKGSALQLGWMEAAFGIGVLAGGALLGVWGGFERRINTMIVGTGLLGLMMVVIGTVPANRIFLAIGAMLLVGVGLSFSNGAGQALLQVLIVPDMQGRVFATLRALRTLMSPLGLALAGPFTDTFGLQAWMLGAGIGITIMVAAMPLIPEVANIEAEAHS